MALSSAVVRRVAPGGQRKRVVDVTFDASYVTGGLAFNPADVELSIIDAVDFSHCKLGAAVSTNVVRYDAVNNKLLVFTAAGAEVAAATNLSTFVARMTVEGV